MTNRPFKSIKCVTSSVIDRDQILSRAPPLRAFIRHLAIITAIRVLVAETEELAAASSISIVSLGVRERRNIRRSVDEVVGLIPV